MNEDSWGLPSQESAPGVVRSPANPRMAALQDARSSLKALPNLLNSKSKTLRLLAAGACTGLAVWLFVGGKPPAPPVASSTNHSSPESGAAVTLPSPMPLQTPPGHRVPYYISIHELDGLPLNISPWTEIEIWVAWDPPVTDHSFVQKLLTDVYVEKVLAPVVPEEPIPVLLSIRKKDLPDLLYGDRYGALSAVVRPAR